MWQYQIIGLAGKKCSFVSSAVKQSGGNWELQRPSTTAALSSSHTEDGKQSRSQTATLLNKTEAGCSEIASPKCFFKLQCRVKLKCVEEIKEWANKFNYTCSLVKAHCYENKRELKDRTWETCWTVCGKAHPLSRQTHSDEEGNKRKTLV